MSENSQSAKALARAFSPATTNLKPHERVPAAMAHLVSLPPIWGVVFSAGIIHYFRESSRAVAFQAARRFSCICPSSGSAPRGY